LSKRNSTLLTVVGALCAQVLISTPTTAQQIVKWTDAEGQIHFSDHAPPGQTATNVVVQKAPKTVPLPNPAAPRPVDSRYGAQSGAGSGPGQTATDSEAARRALAAQEQQRRWDEQNKAAAAARLKADQAVIAECKANRETYCNQSADAIRKQEHTIAEMQYADAVTHRQELADRGIYTPPPPPPPPMQGTSNYPTPTNKVCRKADCSDVTGHSPN